ncbi:MAG: imidazole glycerol phosphate synthase subunit HisH [Oscillospiraceae bacterium]|nr:imidazole glycerol phosphate synthase subunit HisH [Oscillospiraceae bacterium]
MITIVDYGLSNLLSVKRAVEVCGEKALITSDPQVILDASAIILPGVGAFADGMNRLRELDLEAPMLQKVRDGTPFLGICLGMQMMFSSSEEGEPTAGLDIIQGSVVRIPDLGTNGKHQRVPHVGWEPTIEYGEDKDSLFNGTAPNRECYYVHSYEAVPDDRSRIRGVCLYGGREVVSVVRNIDGNAVGCQFHPEKSGKTGLNILQNFLCGI